MTEISKKFEKINSTKDIEHLLLDDVMFEFIKYFKYRQDSCKCFNSLHFTNESEQILLDEEILRQLDYYNNKLLEILKIKL